MQLKFKALLPVIITIASVTGSFAQHKTAKKAPVKAGGLNTQIASGEKLYKQYCLSCHQADGGGVPNMNPPLIKTSYVLGEKGRIIKVVLNGLSGQDIDDNRYNNVMPAFDYLKDDQVADVLTYVRNSFSNKASAVKTAEVTKLRGKK